MANSAAYARSFRPLGLTFDTSDPVSFEVGIPWSVTVPAAKIGQLTTRTDATTGTLTMNSGHGITTGARLDLYWSGGSRRGITVGTVATNSVPFSGGSGDNLPNNLTAVTAMVPDSEAVAAVGDDLTAIAVKCPLGGTVVFADGSNTELYARVQSSTGTSWVWNAADGGTNPLAGVTVAKVFLSHGDSSQSAEMTGCVLYS